MADDKNQDLDPEEDKFDDDEDFGLPDLDDLDDDSGIDDELDAGFDEDFSEEDLDLDEDLNLDDLDEDLGSLDDMDEPVEEEAVAEAADSDMEISDDLEMPDDVTEEDMVEDSDDDDFGDLDMDDLDMEGEDLDISDEDLQAELDGMDDDAGFDEGDEGIEIDDSEIFGEDDTESLESLGIEEESSEFEEPTPAPTGFDSANEFQKEEISQNKGKFTKIVVFGTIIITVVALVLYFTFGGDSAEGEEMAKKEEAKKEQPVKKATPKPKPKPKPAETKPKPAETKPTPAPASQVAAGTVTMLDTRTGKSYIIINSFIDEDLAGDFAKSLSDSGKSPYILAPQGEGKFYRVAIAEFGTYDAARQNVSAYQGEFGTDIWTLKY